MKLLLTKTYNTVLTLIIVPLTVFPSCLLFLVRRRLHGEFVRLLFLQDHREIDRFLAASGVQLAQTNFHFRRAAFSSQLKSRVGNILAKAAALLIVLNIDGAPIASRSHSPITHSKLSPINLVSILRTTQCM